MDEKEKIQLELEELLKKVELLKGKIQELETPKTKTNEELKILENLLKNVLDKPKEKDKSTSKIINIDNRFLNNANLTLTLNKMPTPEETNIISRYLEEWFYELPAHKIVNSTYLCHSLISIIRELGLLEMKGITVACALNNDEKTIVARIGNTPIYKYTNGEIQPINIAENTLISTEILDNTDYQSIVLFTDNEQDDLSNERVKVISKNTDRQKLAVDLLEFHEPSHKVK